MAKEENTKTQITVKIDNYIYEAQDTLYKVLSCSDENDNEYVVVGSFPRLETGLYYDFFGRYTVHKKYGSQFIADTYQRSKNFSTEGLVSYLSSERFKGIGTKIAQYIVDELGTDCIDKILENPDCLDNVYGITQQRKNVIVEALNQNFALEQMYIRLYGYSLTAKMIKKLYDVYGDSVVSVIEDNPYTLITDIEGFGFKKCDALAMKLGFKIDDLKRIKASIVYTISYVCYQQGFTFITHEQLYNSVKQLLANNPLITDKLIDEAIEDMLHDSKIIVENDRFYEPSLYQAENTICNKLIKIANVKHRGFTLEKIKEALAYVQNNLEINYTPLQKEAIENALYNKLSIITGGPGTGKSTILNGIIKCYAYLNNLSIGCDELDYKIMLAAPTGRASKRMSETTNCKASTIHKALGFTYDGFSYNENNLLPKSLVIIDETSMLDVTLCSQLFKALPNTVQLIFVGDVNQLPSVGPGNVLFDLINSSMFKTTVLNQIMRQANDSNIIRLSHMILQERIDYSIFSMKKEVFFYDFDSHSLLNGIYRILDKFIQGGGSLQSDIQILAPMYAGVAGIESINKAIQERYNLEKEKILVRDSKLFKKNDKVLQLKNNTELDIMNGDIGKIVDIVKKDDKDYLKIDFDGRVVDYSAYNLDELTLAYAISIHKSQGAEFKNVVMPILPSYHIMLKKKLIYTAVTRAKSKLIILGKLESLASGISSMEYQRQTSLAERLNNYNSASLSNVILDSNIPFDTLGEYDMEGITPYSFM